jgi:hypothetical protein
MLQSQSRFRPYQSSADLVLRVPFGACIPSRIVVWLNRSLCLAQQKPLSGPTQGVLYLLAWKGTRMKRMAVAVLIVAWWVPTGAFADERVGSAALGAVSGALVLGPVGAVAGAAVGYVAGPSIARSWGLHSEPPHAPGTVKSSRKATSRRGPPIQVKSRADVSNSSGLNRTAAENSRKEAAPSPVKRATASESKRSRDWESYCTTDCASSIQF